MKKSILYLLQKLETSTEREEGSIISLNAALSKVLKKGGYDIKNGVCGGTNTSCENTTCPDSRNHSCLNHSCLV